MNLDIQTQRSTGQDLPGAVKRVWEGRLAQDALEGPGGSERERALFGLAVCRLIMRSFAYPAVFRREEPQYKTTLKWLTRVRDS